MKVNVKKRLALVIGGLCVIAGLVGYMFYAQSIQNGQDTVVEVYQNDENGTPINSPSPLKIVRKAGHRNPFKDGISEYVIISKNPLGNLLTTNNQTIRLRYRSERTTKQLQNRLSEANYLQAGTQNVAVPVFNGTQVRTKAHKVPRVSTSLDGRQWTKLPISYPNVTMTNPTVLYQNNRLILIDQHVVYETANFKQWQSHSISIKDNQFTKGKAQNVIPESKQRAVMIAMGDDSVKGKRQLYYADWQPAQRQVSHWQRIKTDSLKIQKNAAVKKVGSNFYLLQYQGRYVQVARAKSLREPFKKVARIKISIAKHQRIESINLIQTERQHYQLMYNKIGEGNVQLGTYYRKFQAGFDSTGSQQNLLTDYLWTNFEIIENRR